MQCVHLPRTRRNHCQNVCCCPTLLFLSSLITFFFDFVIVAARPLWRHQVASTRRRTTQSLILLAVNRTIVSDLREFVKLFLLFEMANKWTNFWNIYIYIQHKTLKTYFERPSVSVSRLKLSLAFIQLFTY